MDAVKVYKQVLASRLRQFPLGFWSGAGAKSRARAIIKYMIKKLGIPPDEFEQSTFRKNKLGGMLRIVFRESPFLAIENCYPGKFRKWQFKVQGMWKGRAGLRLAKEAVRWLVEEKLRIRLTEIPDKISYNSFQDYGLNNMLNQLFEGSPFLAIQHTYPGRVTWWEMRHDIRSPRKYKSNHGHFHKSMFQCDVDDWLWQRGVRDHAHDVPYPESQYDCDIVVELLPRRAKSKLKRRVFIECAGMMHLDWYRKRIQEKKAIARKHKLKLIIIYLKDTAKEWKRKLGLVVAGSAESS